MGSMGIAPSAQTQRACATRLPRLLHALSSCADVQHQGLRACLTSHESRAGHVSKCVWLMWDPFHSDHGKNVVTVFTIQVRRSVQARGSKGGGSVARGLSPGYSIRLPGRCNTTETRLTLE